MGKQPAISTLVWTEPFGHPSSRFSNFRPLFRILSEALSDICSLVLTLTSRHPGGNAVTTR